MTNLDFLQTTFVNAIEKLDPSTAPQWGKMNVRQMVEHMSDSVRIANGKDPHHLVTPSENVAAFRQFALSDKSFRPNTKNALMSEEPAPVRLPTYADAIAEWKSELAELVKHFENQPEKKVMNPFFGEFTFDEWLHLLVKHAKHHLLQFGFEE